MKNEYVFRSKSELLDFAKKIKVKGRSKIENFDDLIKIMKKEHVLERKELMSINQKIRNLENRTRSRLRSLPPQPNSPIEKNYMEIGYRYFKEDISWDHLKIVSKGHCWCYVTSPEVYKILNSFYNKRWEIRQQVDNITSVNFIRKKKLFILNNLPN